MPMRGVVIVDHLHLRDDPQGEAIGEIIGWLRRGEEFEVTGAPVDQKENRWLPVKVKSTGMHGWLAEKRHDGSQTYVHLWREVAPPKTERWLRPPEWWRLGVIITAIFVIAGLAWLGI